MYKFDIVIVGGGILAYSTAYSIISKDPTIKLAIVAGRTSEGMGTLASGAMLGNYAEVTKHSLHNTAGKIKHEMAIQAARMWPNWVEKIKEATCDKLSVYQNLIINPGTFVILNTKAGYVEKDNFNAILQALEVQDEPYMEVEQQEIPGFSPSVDCALLKAIYLPNEGTIDSNCLLSALKKSVYLSKNCTILDEDIVKLHTNISYLNYIETHLGKLITGDKFLLAAGAYSQVLINQLPSLRDSIPPIFSGVGLSLVVDQVNPRIIVNIRTPNRAGACGLHALPRSDNLYIGATNYLSLLPKNNPSLGPFTFLLQSALAQINQTLYQSKLISYVVGNRAITFDTFPLIGKTSIDNFWVLSGTYRDGFHLSPFIAEIISSEMLGHNSVTATPYSIFSPERLPIQTMSREEIIKDTVNQCLSSAFDHSMKLPYHPWENMFEEMLYLRIQNLYKKLDTHFNIPAEIIMAIDPEKPPAMLKRHLKYLNEISKNSSQ